jgi:hypothetical protein
MLKAKTYIIDFAFSNGRAITAFSPFMTIGLSIRIG